MAISLGYADQYGIPQQTLGMMQPLVEDEKEEEKVDTMIQSNFEVTGISDRMLEFSSSCTQVAAAASSDDSQNFNGITFSSPVDFSNGVHTPATCDQFLAAEPGMNPCELTGFYVQGAQGVPSYTDPTTWNIMSNSSILINDGYETTRSFALNPDSIFVDSSANFAQSHEDRQQLFSVNMFQNGAEVSGRALHQLFESRRRAQLGGMVSASLLDEVAAQAKARLEVKKLRRMESNRASARRSRKRKADSLDSLHIENVRLREEYVPHILQEKNEVEKRLKESETKIIKLEKEKVELAQQIQRLTQQK